MIPNITPLELTSMGSTDGFAIWRVRNLNYVNMNFTWQVYETGQKGKGIALARYDVFFKTILTDGSNTTRILVNGMQHNIRRASLSQDCYCTIEPLPEPLTAWRYFSQEISNRSDTRESAQVW
ncbi:hypothetical protein [Limnofasciculus baicalensis]|uniref:Uncharacterized protein n=1 Tax=Limnofasciculus baicalensis BBK-W-15 TaxID=2699891 RepID=A0AAE3KM08_9CYAN|nr:hypothetical protein [Limnofasciculus baicalensis]MCP2729060.1 hypothetical protein [Limnofasciculus baicalensis BBK-W-15]